MSSSTKIVWCTDSPGWGGAELALLRVLQMTGLESCCVLHSLHAAPKLLEALRVLRVRTRTVSPGGNTLRTLVCGLLRARSVVRDYPGAVFVIWGHHLDSNRWMQLGLALSGAKYIVAERLIPASAVSLEHSRLTKPLKRYVARRAVAVVVNGRSQLEHYATLFSVSLAGLQVISNSRPVVALHDRVAQLREDRDSLRTAFGFRNDATVITCVGRLTVQKSQSTLIEAITRLVTDHPHLQLVFVGDGDLQSELKLLAQSLPEGFVTFIAHVQDVIPYLAVTDIFVLPSLAEGLSGALIEAMAAGLPCVTTDIPGNRELVTNGVSGLLVPPQDAEALAAALRLMLDNPAETQRMAAAGYTHVLKNYDQATEALLWKDLFNRVSCHPKPN